LNIIVCVKQVVDTGAALRLEDGKVNTEGLPRVMNPYDEYAAEEAIRIRERDPETTVTVISLGPENLLILRPINPTAEVQIIDLNEHADPIVGRIIGAWKEL